MYRARQALQQGASESPKLPLLDGLEPLYTLGGGGVFPRRGNMLMIAGRGGNGKSSFVMNLVQRWNEDTLYFSADMSRSQATLKLLSHKTQTPFSEVEEAVGGPDGEEWLKHLDDSRISFSFRNPIRFDDVMQELNAYVTLYNKYPDMLVFDNLANFEGAESDYSEQFFALSVLSELSRETGATTIVLHHAKDTSWDAKDRPYYPPSRNEVKGGHFEFPEMVLSVALNNSVIFNGAADFHVAALKNRQGYQDPTANTYAKLRVNSETNTFFAPDSEDYFTNGA